MTCTVTREIRPDWDLSTPGSARPGMAATTRTSTDGTSGSVSPMPRY